MAYPEGRLLLPAALACVFLAGCAATGTAPLPAGRQHALQALAVRHHVCAVTLAVIKDRKLDALESAGGCAPAAPPQPDSVFQAASLSKPVFAYAVLKLVEEGKMALDAPVMRYLPEGYRRRFDPMKAEPAALVNDPRLARVTVRMVLNHTAGLPNWAFGPLRFEAEPGSRWIYSGEGYLLLQRAVEAVTGQPLDRFMAERVFAPLGMQRSSYVWNEQIAAGLQSGRKANGAPRTTIDLKEPLAAFSLLTTAADYGRFIAALLNDERLLGQLGASPVAVDRERGLEWGLGWGIEQAGDERYLWQWGNNTGYRAFAMFSVRSGDGFVMLTNSENGLQLAQPLARTVFGREHTLFQSSMLGGDLLVAVCNTLRLCL